MTTDMTRRQMLGRSSAVGLGIAFAGSIEAIAGPGTALAATPAPNGYGPLVPDPAGLLALPRGFSYTIVARAGETMTEDGVPTPSDADGTAAFARVGGSTLVNNHEIGDVETYGVPSVDGLTYDANARGGTTTIEVDKDGNRIREYVSVAGTHNNCAGGITPWGTWLTCEETETKAGGAWTGNGTSGVYSRDHGYAFEVFADGRAIPEPIKAFGRYAHEALAIDPQRRRVYLSEDASNPNGLFYRWTAPKGVTLEPGIARRLGPTDGTLEAMAIVMDDGSVLPDVAYLTSAQLGRPFPVKWVNVPERDGQTTSVRKQFADGQVTRGKKFEGVWGTDDGVYVVNSFAFNSADLPADAAKHDGMVWFYSYADETITLVTYFPHQQTAADGSKAKFDDLTFDGPDNVTVTPWGTLVLAEDGAGASHVLSSVPGGPSYAIARNQLNDSEFPGPTFSDDGRTLFVNIQTPGITLAITGPWATYLS